MEYTIELYPARLATALAAFVKHVPESTFATRDLLIGHVSGSGYRLGVADRRPPDSKEPLVRTYLVAVEDNGALKPLTAPDSAPMPNERVWPGDIVPALVAGIAAHGDSPPKGPGAMVAWRVEPDIVTLMFVPGRTDADGAVIGGMTSQGREIHYHVSRAERKVVRTTLAR